MGRLLLTMSILLSWAMAWGQHKSLPAVKASGPPVIDGNLDDAAWAAAPVATGFIQNFPRFGDPASKNSEVRILYDDEAVYIGAYLYDDPSTMRKQLTARDGEQRQDVDYFSVFFDTYNDLQNGFQFLVTPMNVQTDAKLDPNANTGFGDFGDKAWDAVWQSQTKMADNGWTLEMRIPYISLRFAKREVQTWGLQFLRFTRGNNESAYWNPVNPNVNGFVNQFGKLADLREIQPPLRLSFSPYLSTGVRMNPPGSRRQTEWLRSGGMDVKYGINESFTLDATLIPDFGQVVSDNVVNNLSPFEVRFQENRPFFTEGTELFNKAGLFYSRRVGATPAYYGRVEALAANGSDYEIVRNPSLTQLYNGIKFSGRTRKNLGIGVFNAVTAPMEARLRNTATGKDTLIETEPLANYNIIVVDQALKDRSSLTFTNTNVMRSGHHRDANVSSLDWSLFFRQNMYRLQGTARYSTIFGYTPYNGSINLVYDTVSRNGGLFVKPYDGYNTTLRFSKVSGLVQFYTAANITSHTYDPTDLGYLQTPNVVNYNGGISYNQFQPTKRFIQYRYAFDMSMNYLYKPYRFGEIYLSASGFWWFRNFWDISVEVSAYPTTQRDYFELRTPERFVNKPAEVTFEVFGSSDSRKPFFFSWGGAYAPRAKRDNDYNNMRFGVRYRFSSHFTLSLDASRQYENNQIGYAFRRETNGEPIIGYRDYNETVSVLSGIYNFTPRLNLTLRARHYWNKVVYNSFYNVDAGGHHLSRDFLAGLDENYNAFNLDAFLTWDFRLGSRVILGWKNWLGNEGAIDGAKYRNYFGNLGRVFSADHGNELTLRVIYFLDYNQLRGKR